MRLAEQDPSTAGRIHAVVVAWLRRETGQDVERVPHDAPLTSMGVDSVAAVALALDLERALACHLPPELLYEVSTIGALAEFVDSGALAKRVAESSLPSGRTSVAAPTAQDNGAGEGEATVEGGARSLGRYAARNRRLVQMKAEGRYFFEAPISEQSEGWVVVEGRRMLMLGSYSYLGLMKHPDVERAAKEALETFGTGHHGARLLSGTTTLHRTLERRLAELLRADDSIVYSSGYTTNCTTVPALVGEGDCVIGDEWNHASLVEGCWRSGATFLTFAHGDLRALEARLTEAAGRHTLVAVDSVFSMDGDVVDLPGVVELCRRHGALLMVDEAHSFGVLGARGHGVQEHFGLPADAIDIKMATLSKAVPSSGGVIAGRQEIVDYLRHNTRGYIFTGPLPPVCVAAALAGLDVIDREPERLGRLWHNVRRYHRGLAELGFRTGNSTTPITPILCPDEATTIEMTRLVRADGVFVVPVVYPAVPMNAPRLRTCVVASHGDDDVDLAIETLARAGRRVGLIA
jgi:8-amino-7-oxononanoate synthase